MSDDKTTIIKAGVAWCGVGISKFLAMLGIASWGDFAAALAALYSILLIYDWARKKWRARA